MEMGVNVIIVILQNLVNHMSTFGNHFAEKLHLDVIRSPVSDWQAPDLRRTEAEVAQRAG